MQNLQMQMLKEEMSHRGEVHRQWVLDAQKANKENERLRAENERLRAENEHMRAQGLMSGLKM